LSVSNFHVFETVGNRAFPVAAARLWNSLPSHVTAAPFSPSSAVVLNHISFSLSYPAFCLFAHLYSALAVMQSIVILDALIVITFNRQVRLYVATYVISRMSHITCALFCSYACGLHDGRSFLVNQSINQSINF